MTTRPNIIVIVIDDLRWDELGVTGHPYMKTPHIDRLAHEGARFTHAFHTTPLCSPNRASHPDRAVREPARDHRQRRPRRGQPPAAHLPAGAAEAPATRRPTSASGTWATTRRRGPGNDYWVSFRGQGKLVDPELQENGQRRVVRGYVTDLLNERACAFVARPRQRPVRPLPGAQGGAPRPLPAPGRHDRPRLARRLRAGGAAPGPLPRRGVPAAAERPAARDRRRAPSRRSPRRSRGRSGSPPGAPCSTRFTREPRRRSASARR